MLKPGGILIDLRPAAVHRRVGLRRAGGDQPLGVMRESFDDDHAANRAVAEVVRRGWFDASGRVRFECHRTMDSLAQLRDWLDEFTALGKLPSHDWLLQAAARALGTARGRAKIVISGPLDLRVLKKPKQGAFHAR